MAERFESQRALLEYLNKNVNDRSLIQRMMRRGEVYKEDGAYWLVGGEKGEKKSEPEQSKDVATMDEKELKELKEMNEKLIAAYKKERRKNEVYMGMYDHLVFFYNKFIAYKRFVDGKVFGQKEYDIKRGIQQTEEAVRPMMYERYNFEFGEVEDAECKAVEEIIRERGKELAELPF